MTNGYLNSCKECVKYRVSDYYYKNIDTMREKERLRYQRRRKNPLFQKACNERSRKWRTKEKMKAHNIVERKFKKLKPDNCEICDRKLDLLHAHHPDYKHPAFIIWCCPACHRRLHMGEIKGKKKGIT